MAPISVTTGNADNLRYPVSHWSPYLLAWLEAGPLYLNRHLSLPLAPPPANDSKETLTELAYLRQVTARRGPHDLRLINGEAEDPSLLFLSKLGLEPDRYPHTIVLIKAALRDVGYFILREKWRYQRARPKQLAPDLPLAIPTPPHAAYPSGHAGHARAVALLLSRLAPRHEAFWMHYADAIGKRREIAGVHYPSDTRAGIQLADYLVPKLLAQPAFSRLLRVARDEWTLIGGCVVRSRRFRRCGNRMSTASTVYKRLR